MFLCCMVSGRDGACRVACSVVHRCLHVSVSAITCASLKQWMPAHMISTVCLLLCRNTEYKLLTIYRRLQHYILYWLVEPLYHGRSIN